jgi:DNA topoisomerase I
MAKKPLIIVESPAKIKTLRKFFGAKYSYTSSVGHIRDLPKKKFGIDTEHDFEPVYEVLPDKKKVVKDLVDMAKKADVVYLSPDPDREGEAIAWHIAALLPKGTVIKRTAFNEITKKAVSDALEHPSEINMALVNAQQARRLLDRIVGYKISPILSRRLTGGGRDGWLSAGRVQSVALKLVVDREKEIEAFEPVEYWTLDALVAKEKGGETFKATLFSIDGKKVEKEPAAGKAVISDEKTAKELKKRIEDADVELTRVEKKERKRNPVAPFITSSLQQEASRHFGFSSSRTMTLAQQLYEGAEGTEGLITYMRTDSVRTAPEAIGAVRGHIEKTYGPQYLPKTPRLYRSKKSAQEAHEAIRPTNLSLPPEKAKGFLGRDLLRLYTLIWRRFVASQMVPAVYDTVSADVETNNGLLLRATGSTLKFNGFLAVYEERRDDEAEGESKLPHLEAGEPIRLDKVDTEQSFTRPPPRFTEALLVKELEKCGIGRPSTYAAIMAKIQGRDYTTKEGGRLKPTELGRVCAEMLEGNFPQIMDINFTAAMEDDLELIAAEKKEWKKLIRSFWKDFMPTVEKAEKEAFVPRLETDLPCPKCKKPLQKIWSKSKYFLGCTGYPDCDYSAPLEEVSFNKEDYAEDFDWEQPCPNCKAAMQVRHGRYGTFLGCSKYPKCRGTVRIPKKGEEPMPEVEGEPCPAIGCEGTIRPRKSRYGKIFFSCSNYPDCDVIVNDITQLKTKYADHPKTAYVRKKGGGAQGSKKASSELEAVIGAKEATRGEVMKGLWAYIKKHKLQDPDNGRIIIPDDKLAAVFGSKEPVDMFKLAGLVGKHLK